METSTESFIISINNNKLYNSSDFMGYGQWRRWSINTEAMEEDSQSFINFYSLYSCKVFYII